MKPLLILFELNGLNCLRGNKFKVYKERFKLNVRKYFFNQRIVDVWKSLPNKVVCCNTLMEFIDKKIIKIYLEKKNTSK